MLVSDWSASTEFGGTVGKPVIQGLSSAFGPRTAEVMVTGTYYLTAVWDAAYVESGQPALAPRKSPTSPSPVSTMIQLLLRR